MREKKAEWKDCNFATLMQVVRDLLDRFFGGSELSHSPIYLLLRKGMLRTFIQHFRGLQKLRLVKFYILCTVDVGIAGDYSSRHVPVRGFFFKLLETCAGLRRITLFTG